MSQLLDEVIKLRREHADRYAEWLKKIADLVVQVQAGHDAGAPEVLRRSSGLRAIYNNLQQAPADDGAAPASVNLRDGGRGPLPEPDARLRRAVEIDETIRRVRPAHWRDNQAKENTIKRALLPLLDGDPVEVERVFRIIKAQPEY